MATPRPDGVPLIARILITDLYRRVLIVHTIGRHPLWVLPGGLVEPFEPPRAAAEREVREELGIEARAQALLTVQWTAPLTPGRRPRMTLYFDGPQLDSEETARIAVQPAEVDAYEWADHDRAVALLPPGVAAHVGYPLPYIETAHAYIETSPELHHEHPVH